VKERKVSDFNEMEKHLAKTVETIKTIGGLLTNWTDIHGLGWYLKEISLLPEVVRSLLPAKEGDRVVLVNPVKCEGGRKSSEHFMQAGSQACIASLGISDGKMYANLVFDDESWIDYKGEKHPITANKHYYGIGFEYFKKL
jgi:hypothetical protein